MPAATSISVIVPVLDDAQRLGACLDGLLGQTGAVDLEVVVVDNGSTDGSAEVAVRHPLSPRLVTEPRRGSYAARNAGLAVARGDVVAFIDADCVPAPEWAVAGASAVERSPVVGGAVRQRRSAHPTVWERYDCAVYLRQEDVVREQGYAATANLWVRREVLDQVGLFDASLLSSGDFEWGQRAIALGHRAVFAPGAVVGHAPRTDLRGTWRLHHRLGAGWARLVGEYPRLREALWLPLGTAVDLVAADGPALRRRQLAPVHAVAMAARRAGWAQARGQSTRRRARAEP